MPALAAGEPDFVDATRVDVDRPFGCRLDSLKATFPLLQIDGLIVAARIEFRAPYFMQPGARSDRS